MRRQNSEINTSFISEAGSELKNNDYFGFVELDKFACYVIADGIDDIQEAESAKLAIKSIITKFEESPSLSWNAMYSYIYYANRELLNSNSRNKLKASVTIVVTNYVKMRYACAGNTRLRFYRENTLKFKSEDMSLAQDMVNDDVIPKDKLAMHEERNNLYAYLGQDSGFHPYISPKIKLRNSDIITLYTRGVWENLDESELDDVFSEATNDTKQSLDNVEDMLLSRQPAELENYTLAVIFIDKIFTDPNKKRLIKRIVIISLIIIIVIIIIIIIIYLVHRKKVQRYEDMNTYITSTVSYINDNNYIKAEQAANKAYELAEKLRDKTEKEKINNYIMLIDSILNADELISQYDFTKAYNAYNVSLKYSRIADNYANDYIRNQLQLLQEYDNVTDLLELGDILFEKGSYLLAEEKYNEAKKLASSIYYSVGKQDAADRLKSVYEALAKIEADTKEEAELEKAEAAELKEQERIEAEEQKEAEKLAEETASKRMETLNEAIQLISEGDKSLQLGDYVSALAYYSAAKNKLEELNEAVKLAEVEGKIEQANKKIKERDDLIAIAEMYSQAGTDALSKGNVEEALKYNQLAKEIYLALGMTDMAAFMDNKIMLEGDQYSQKLQELEDQAKEAEKKLDNLVVTLQEKENAARELESIGDSYFDNGNYYLALKYYTLAHDTYTIIALNDDAFRMQANINHCLYLLNY